MTVKIITVKMRELTCAMPSCRHVWRIPIDRELPKVCSRCKSRNWNTKNEKKETK